MEKQGISLLISLLKMSEETLLLKLPFILKKLGYKKTESTNNYIFAKGNIPVLLIAHVDTVLKSPPTEIFYDSEKTVMWSPRGLGADDRAGIFSILKILEDNSLRPSILFTNGEEKGGIGAKAFVLKYPKSPIKNLKYIIQLDRQGEKDCVFYDCGNKKFEKYVNSFGFKTEWGTFTDISIIAPKWDIAAVNLSVGYFYEHTTSEHLVLNYMVKTIFKVTKMLKDAKSVKKFDFQADYSYYSYSCDVPSVKPFEICDRCFGVFPCEELNLVTESNSEEKLYCPECFDIFVDEHKDTLRWCTSCGYPFVGKKGDEKQCPFCTLEKEEKNGKIR